MSSEPTKDIRTADTELTGSVIHLRITSRREFLDPVHNLTEQLIAQVGFSEDESYWMVTAVREAVTNALLHGNNERPGTFVEIEFELIAEGIRITITDQETHTSSRTGRSKTCVEIFSFFPFNIYLPPFLQFIGFGNGDFQVPSNGNCLQFFRAHYCTHTGTSGGPIFFVDYG